MKHSFFKRISIGVTALLLTSPVFTPTTSDAHCGLAGCLINTDWETQGVWADPGTLLDLQFQYIDQDRLLGVRPSHHGHGGGHRPERVITRQTNLRISHGFNDHFGLEFFAPWINRRYEDRRFDGHGNSYLDITEFSKPGDVRLLGRYQFSQPGEETAYGIRMGVKLPTGDFEQTSAAGRNADRRLQPGTGTTDLIFDAFANGSLPIGTDLRWFTTIGIQESFAKRRNFAPGTEIKADFGVRLPVIESLELLGQVNARWSDRDRGARGFPRDSGGTVVSLTPGLLFRATDKIAVYTLAEFPVIRDLNGEQLVNDYALSVGMAVKF